MRASLVYTVFLFLLTYARGSFLVGAGVGDVTGPAAEVNLMGYAQPTQTARGIHTRLFARAFVFAEVEDPSQRFVFVSVDSGMVMQAIRLAVVERLSAAFDGLYNEKNIILSGTHTHSGQAGFSQYVLYDITSLGFVRESYDAFVDGIEAAVRQAHQRVRPARVQLASGELLDASINRSPTAYLENPAEERAKYQYDTDKEMTLLRIQDADSGKDLGSINWFAVHCTSMNNTNRLLSGDNKGYASYLFEQWMNGNDSIPGHGEYVAAFAQSNLGDVSPNTRGPRCLDSGKPCDPITSTCHGKNELCVAFGPGNTMKESTEIIGERQYRKAQELFDAAEHAGKPIEGSIEVRHVYVDMSSYAFTWKDESVHTCKPAMGYEESMDNTGAGQVYAFAAGTIDGPGAFNFHQNATTANPFWNLVRDAIHDPTKEQIECQKPKPILLDTGEMSWPYEWQPHVVDCQIVTLGNVVREALGGPYDVVIAGLANTYSSYIATPEEYQQQRYEAASTIFGPNTLNAYLDIYGKLASSIRAQTDPQGIPAARPPNFVAKQVALLPPVIVDGAPLGKAFGEVETPPHPTYARGSTVAVTFVGANPRNDRKANATFLTVEKRENESGERDAWSIVATDAHWETEFHWERHSVLSDVSYCTVKWNVPSDAQPGVYRIKYFGDRKHILGHVESFSGTSPTFTVTSSGV